MKYIAKTANVYTTNLILAKALTNHQVRCWGFKVEVMAFLNASSFWSINSKKLWMALEHWELDETVVILCCRWWRTYNIIIRKRKNAKAARAMKPLRRYRPQKLIKWSRSGSDCCILSAGQPFLQNHFSWIFWSFPLSDNFRIAVDISTDKGESLFKA